MVLTWPVRIARADQNDGVRGRSRRAVLHAGALVAVTAALAPLTGCDLFDRDPDPPEPDPLAPLITGALDLAGQHEAAIAGFPELADRLSPIAAAHRAHAAELARVTGVTLPSGTPAPAATTPAADAPGTLAGLRTAEQQAQDAATQACLAAPTKRAALVGSIAAARATHVEILR
jgi:hypothetical protein